MTPAIVSVITAVHYVLFVVVFFGLLGACSAWKYRRICKRSDALEASRQLKLAASDPWNFPSRCEQRDDRWAA